jgi:hypothetical protein
MGPVMDHSYQATLSLTPKRAGSPSARTARLGNCAPAVGWVPKKISSSEKLRPQLQTIGNPWRFGEFVPRGPWALTRDASRVLYNDVQSWDGVEHQRGAPAFTDASGGDSRRRNHHYSTWTADRAISPDRGSAARPAREVPADQLKGKARPSCPGGRESP